MAATPATDADARAAAVIRPAAVFDATGAAQSPTAAPASKTAPSPGPGPAAAAIAQAAAPTASPAPSVATAATVAPAAPTASAASSAPAFQTFADQVSKPVIALAAAGDGDHTVTISVTPDNLGPVTVRAHVSGENMRIELFAPSDTGRDALRQLLPDLRRDLSATGANANLDLSSQGRPDGQPDTGTLRENPWTTERRSARPESSADAPPATAYPPRAGSPTGLDVLA